LATVDQSSARGNRPRGHSTTTNQKGDVTREYLPFGIQLGTDRLREADNDAARKRTPQAPEAADDHRLECVDQPRRTDGRIEIGADAKVERGDGCHHHRHPHGDRVDPVMVDAHQLRDFEIVGRRAKRPAQRGAIEQQIEQQDHRDGRAKREQRHHSDRKVAAELN
jgi:hypothetical protein